MGRRRRRRNNDAGLVGLASTLLLLYLAYKLVMHFILYILLVAALALSLVVVVRLVRWHRGQTAQGSSGAPEHRSRAASLDDLLLLSPSGFEAAVAQILGRLGYQQVRLVGGADDRGVDIVCSDDDGRKVVVQCKRYAPGHRVSSPELQLFLGMMVYHQAECGIYVTTSTFSRRAREIAATHPQNQILLIDGEVLERLINTDEVEPAPA